MLINCWSVSKTAETDLSRPRSWLQVQRPRQILQNSSLEQYRDQDRGLRDYLSALAITKKSFNW